MVKYSKLKQKKVNVDLIWKEYLSAEGTFKAGWIRHILLP